MHWVQRRRGFSDCPFHLPFPNSSVLASYHGFNLYVEQPMVFQEDGAGFGQSVVQFGRSRLVVGAPLEVVAVNKTGRLYDCLAATGLCRPILLNTPPEAVNTSLGLSLVASTDLSWLLACGPTMHRACGESMYAKGACLLLGSHLQIIRTVPATLRSPRDKCPNQEIDIVFLIDGSGSIDRNDFKRMKNFVRAVMDQFKGTHTLFLLMQYSNLLKTHFTFSQFQTSRSPQSLVDPIVQLGGLTVHISGCQDSPVFPEELLVLQMISSQNLSRVTPFFFLDRKELFHSKNGARKTADRARIVRYAVGVGDALQDPAARTELNIIGSVPLEDHVFKVDNFAALSNTQKQLQEKIFAVEGKWVSGSHCFGIGCLLLLPTCSGILSSQDGPVLGAVGSFSWSGGAFLYPPNRSPTFINMSQEHADMSDSYLGYSTELAVWKGVHSLVLGAPRHQHTGKVVIFTQVSGQWRPKAEVTGTQIGSYFGASLSSVDVDRDGSSDLVLIGAPHYYEQSRGGQVSVCPFPWGGEWLMRPGLGEQGHPWACFGAALTVLGDVNGDRLSDVAIGAPGEQENRGAVYLFHGTSGLGISPVHSQQIAGSQLSPRLQYFGHSLSGGQDLTQDGLVDLAVGAQGHAVLLRSLSVLNVEVAMRFTPSEVTKSVYQCWEELPTALEAGDATVCLSTKAHRTKHLRFSHFPSSIPPSASSDVRSSVMYDLALDPGRLISRAIFDETKNWTLTRRKTLGLGEHCDTMKLLLPDCAEDLGNPITLRLNFSLVAEPISSSQNLRPVWLWAHRTSLSQSCPSLFSLQTLVVGSCLELNVTVTVWNEGEDSCGTVISFYYPAGLSYRRQPHQHPLRLACEAVPTGNEGLRSSSCSINHPIFQERTKGTFIVTFDVSYKVTLGDKLLLRANASSENNKPTSNNTTFQLELPVKYAVYTVISRQEESTKYFNFSASDQKSRKEAEHRYRVSNLSQRDLAISIHFWVPVLLKGVAVWDVSLPCVSERETPQQPDFQTQIPSSLVLDCSTAACLRFCCDIPSFGIQEELDFILKGNLSFGWASQTLQKKTCVVSVAEIIFNRSVYSQLQGQEAFLRAQVMVLEEYEVYNPIPLIVSSSVGGLLCWLSSQLHCTR
uniref:Integrin subunit alpha D n=1 Tax=Phocoena sinus TaxID=42100 RepID=A0A8C9CEA9_PHOSS